MKGLCISAVLLGIWTVLLGIWKVCNSQFVMDPVVTIQSTDPISDGSRVRGTIAEDVTITCLVENAKDDLYKIRWQRTTFKENFEEALTIPIATDMDSEDINKWSIEKQSTNSRKLRIKALEITDEGNYTCYIELTRETRVFANRTVLVTAPPLILESLTSTDSSGDEGEQLSLTCNASGRPQPTIYWRREGDALLPGGGVIRINPTLRIDELEHSHQGRYFCDAINEVGEDNRDIILSVQYSPKLVAEDINGFSQAVGYKRTLGCLVDSNPRPNYEYDATQLMWIRGSSAVQIDDSRIYTRVVQGAYNRLTYELVFSPVEADDFGTYTCRARNTMGTTDLAIELVETDDPQPDKGYITSSASFISLHQLFSSFILLICASFFQRLF